MSRSAVQISHRPPLHTMAFDFESFGSVLEVLGKLEATKGVLGVEMGEKMIVHICDEEVRPLVMAVLEECLKENT